MEPNLDNITKTPRVLFVDDEAIKLNPKRTPRPTMAGALCTRGLASRN